MSHPVILVHNVQSSFKLTNDAVIQIFVPGGLLNGYPRFGLCEYMIAVIFSTLLRCDFKQYKN